MYALSFRSNDLRCEKIEHIGEKDRQGQCWCLLHSLADSRSDLDRQATPIRVTGPNRRSLG